MTARRTLLRGALGVAASALWVRAAQAAALVTEERPASGFDTVVWNTAGEMWIEQSTRERLTIEAEPEVLKRITAEVRQGRLEIGVRPEGFSTRQPVRFRIELKHLRALDNRASGDVHIGAMSTEALRLVLSGSGNVQVERLNAGALQARLDGSGSTELRGGRVTSQRVDIAGSGEHRAIDLQCLQADLSISGSGSIQVFALEHLNARIQGSGDIEYRGQPRVVQRIDGSGRVTRVDR